MEEKRAHPRYCLWFPVLVEGEIGPVAAVCSDASSGGILINSASSIAVGAEVTVSFRVTPLDDERVAKGRVVRLERRSDNPRDVWSHRLAIEFSEPQVELQELFKVNSSRPPPPA